MQEVSLAAWKKFDQLDDVEEFPVWACVIARYEILMFRRRHARDRLVFSERVYELLADQSLEQVESGAKENASIIYSNASRNYHPQVGN